MLSPLISLFDMQIASREANLFHGVVALLMCRPMFLAEKMLSQLVYKMIEAFQNPSQPLVLWTSLSPCFWKIT
jgi:hypothetical protein